MNGRRAIEGAFRSSARLSRTILDALGHGVCLLGPQGRILQCNQAATDILGCTKRDLHGLSWSHALPGMPTSSSALSPQAATSPEGDPFLRMVSTGSRQHFRVRCQRASHDSDRPSVEQDRWLDISLDPLFGDEGQCLGGVETLADVTTAVQAEESLRQSELRFRSAFQHAPAGMALLDPDLRLMQGNQALCDFLGYPSPGLLPRSMHDIVCPDDLAVLDRGRHAALGGILVPEPMELRYMHRSGQVRYALTVLSLLRDHHGAPQSYVAQLQDITQRIEAEAELRQLSKELRSANERLRHMAVRLNESEESERQRLSRELHDVAGQELTALKIGLGLLSDEVFPHGESPGTSERARERLERELSAAIDMVDSAWNAIRDLARTLRPPALDALGLEAALEGLCSQSSTRSRLEIHYDAQWLCFGPDGGRRSTTGAAPTTAAIGVCLYRCLQEALTNTIRHARANRVWVTVRQAPTHVSLCVRDDGRGWHAERHGPFPESDGLGLKAMLERIELLGGTLDIESKPGEGTALAIALPTEQYP